MPISPKSVSKRECYGDTCVAGFDQTVIDNMVDSFDINPNYEPIYIVDDSSADGAIEFLYNPDLQDSIGYTQYKSWIYDGTEDRQVVGRKYIQMYPYDPPILRLGDYVCWDYYNTGVKSTWLCVAIDSQTLYEQIGSIRLCTNEVRFYNQYGRLLKIPCVFEDKINSKKDITLANLKYINGITTIYMQLNSFSEQLKPNQRLLFGRQGNWVAFRVGSLGVNNFMNTEFNNNNSAHILELTMEGNYVNSEVDDIVNGIADVPTVSYELNLTSISGSIGETYTVEAQLIVNEEVVSTNFVISSSNQEVATTENSSVTLVADGESVITGYFVENPDVTFEIPVTVSSGTQVSNYYVYFTPTVSDGILQGSTTTYTATIYNNGEEVQNEYLVFTLSQSPSSDYFQFTSNSNNTFTITNKKMSKTPLVISYENKNLDISGTLSITLKGAW